MVLVAGIRPSKCGHNDPLTYSTNAGNLCTRPVSVSIYRAGNVYIQVSPAMHMIVEMSATMTPMLAPHIYPVSAWDISASTGQHWKGKEGDL